MSELAGRKLLLVLAREGRRLLECRTRESSISDHGDFETHAAFVARLRAQHGRKTGFWSQVAERSGVSVEG
jgi:hypothetical protein